MPRSRRDRKKHDLETRRKYEIENKIFNPQFDREILTKRGDNLPITPLMKIKHLFKK